MHVDLDDLVHAGILGLFDAASKFNPEKQVVFSSYAKHRIKGAILDSLRQLDWASRDMRRRHKQVEAATRDLAAELQRNPTEGEVAQKLGMDAERWRTMMIDLRNVGLISASTRGNEGDDLPDLLGGQHRAERRHGTDLPPLEPVLDPGIDEVGIVRLAPQLRGPRHPTLATVTVPRARGRKSPAAFRDRVRIVERKRGLADVSRGLSHALGPHDSLDRETDHDRDHHDHDESSHVSPDGGVNRAEGRTRRPPLGQRATSA